MVRKYPRLKPPTGTVCLINRIKSTPIVARLTDISIGGVGIEYNSNDAFLENDITMEILMPNMVRGLKNIACRTVYDIPFSNIESDSTKWRRCGLEFDETISPMQRETLNKFIASLI